MNSSPITHHPLRTVKTSFRFIKNAYADVFRLTRHPRQGLKSLYGVSLYRDAVYLMAGSGGTAILGPVFWGIGATPYAAKGVDLGQRCFLR